MNDSWNPSAHRQLKMLTFCQSLVQDYMSNQARTRLDRLLTESSQYYKVKSENTFSVLEILKVRSVIFQLDNLTSINLWA